MMNRYTVVNLAKQHQIVFNQGFVEWLEQNFHMFELYADLANQVWSRGKRKYSSTTIREKMRFDYDLSEENSKFKISNNVTPDLARMYVLIYPYKLDLFNYHKKDLDFRKYIESHFSLEC